VPSETQRRVGVGNKLPAVKKAEIVGALAQGMTLNEAASWCDVPKNTIQALLNDDEFRDLLNTAEDIAVNTILQEVATSVRRGIKELGPRSLEVLSAALSDEDGRVRLQAAGMVLRGSGMMDGGKELNIRVGLEGLVGNDSPASGD
jgi:hypothetical protein